MDSLAPIISNMTYYLPITCAVGLFSVLFWILLFSRNQKHIDRRGLPLKDDFLHSLQPKLARPQPTEHEACPICYCDFQDAVRLSCGHTFCDLCIRSWFEDSSEQNWCPQCRTVLFALPRQPISLLGLMHRVNLVGSSVVLFSSLVLIGLDVASRRNWWWRPLIVAVPSIYSLFIYWRVIQVHGINGRWWRTGGNEDRATTGYVAIHIYGLIAMMNAARTLLRDLQDSLWGQEQLRNQRDAFIDAVWTRISTGKWPISQ